MFESLLEKILERILGEYVEGLSKDQMKVGIWSGDVDISALRLKPSIVRQLNLPFELKFGMIENLKMKIPWKNLSTSSVEVKLRGLYILVVPKSRAAWKELELDTLLNKQNFVVNFAKNLIDTITEKLKLKGKESEKGFFGKLIEKIIDNLQISIQDIHVRLESVAEPVENLSFGATLDNLNIYTCDESWKPTFVDREAGSRKAAAVVYKSLNLVNFYVYWNAQEDVFLSERCKSKDDYFLMLKSLIFNDANKESADVKKINYLLNFSTVGKLKQTILTQELIEQRAPEFDIEVQLETCNFNLSKAQIKQTSKIINIVNDFTNFFREREQVFQAYRYRPNARIAFCEESPEKPQLIREWWKFAFRAVRQKLDREKGKQSWPIMSVAAKKAYKSTFIRSMRRILFDKVAPEESFTENEMLAWNNILATISPKELCVWIEEDLRKEKIQEEIKKEQSKKSGFLGLWGSKKEVSNDEENKIRAFIEESLKSDEAKIELAADYPRFKVRFVQKRFNIILSKKELIDSTKEDVLLQTKDLQIDVFIKQNGIKCAAVLRAIKLIYKRKDLVDNVLYEQELFFCEKAGESFITLNYEDKPSDAPGLGKRLALNLGSVNFIYNPLLINALTDIFKFEVSNEVTEKIRLQAKKKIREAKDIGETAMKAFLEEQPKFVIDISMRTPQIILPLDYERPETSPCWIFYPGNLEIHGDTYRAGATDEMYDRYSLALEDIQFVFCQSIKFVLGKNTTIEKIRTGEVQEFFYLFKNFNINVDIKTLKKVFVDLNVIDTRILVDTKLNSLRLNLTPDIISKLRQMSHIFLIEETNLKKKEKREILSSANKAGYLNVKSEELVNLYYVALHNQKIYFYEDPRNEEKAKFYVNFDDDPQISFNNSANTISMKSGTIDIELAFENDAMFNSWKNALNEIHLKIQRRLLSEKAEQSILRSAKAAEGGEVTKEQTTEESQNKQIIELQLNFVFADLIAIITDQKDVYTLTIENLNLQLQQTAEKLTTHLELYNFSLIFTEGTETEHILTSHYDLSLASKILKANYVQKQEQLIIIEFEQLKQEDKTLNKARILFGSLFIHLDPSRLAMLMILILGPKDKMENAEAMKLEASTSTISLEENQPELTENVLHIYEPNSSKKNEIAESEIELEIVLEIQAINILFINQMQKIPLADAIVKDSRLEVVLRKGAFTFQGNFLDLVIFDLTNYPNTLDSRRIEEIQPKRFFGRLEQENNQPIVQVNFTSKDAQLFNIGDDLVANTLDVKVNNVSVIFLLQPLMRIINFITDQLLPALTGENQDESVFEQILNTDNNAPALPSTLHAYREPIKPLATVPINNDQNNAIAVGRMTSLQDLRRDTQLTDDSVMKDVAFPIRRQAFIETHKPFWTKITVDVKNTQCKLPINDNSNITAIVNEVSVFNARYLNNSRILMCDNAKQKFPLTGIWNDDYNVKVVEVGLFLRENDKPERQLTSPLSMDILVQLPLFEREYEILYRALKISNHGNRHMQTEVYDTTHKSISLERVYYDNAMIVSVKITPFVLQIGNYEYLSIMGALDTCILYNDGLDGIYIKDFVKKESLKQPGSMYVNVQIDKIALVSLDNKNDNTVTAKVFATGLVFEMVSHPTDESAMELVIQDLKGYHLLKHEQQYHEKGFIGELWISNAYTPKDKNDLQELFLADIMKTSPEGEIDMNAKDKTHPNFKFVMETTKGSKSINIELRDLKVLLQTDVILQLIELTAARDTKQAPITQQQTKKVEQKEQAKQPDVPMKLTVEISNNSFLIPSADQEICLVTKGDITVEMILGSDNNTDYVVTPEVFQSALQRTTVEGAEPTPEEVQRSQVDLESHRTLAMNVKLEQFEIFLIALLDFFREKKDTIPKRPLLLPVTLMLDFNQYQIMKQNVEDPTQTDKVTINKVLMTSELIEFKFSVKDIELLLGIANYQLLMLDSRKTEAETKPDENVDNQNRRETDGLKTSNVKEFTFNYISFNLLDFKVMLINDYQNFFAPTIIFKLRNFKILADLEELIKAVVAFSVEIYYFNSDIFYWEPFIEKATLRVEYSTQVEPTGVVGKIIKVLNREDSTLNINVSIALLDKVKFMMDTFESMKIKNTEEHEHARSVKLDQYLNQLKKQKVLESLAAIQEHEAFQHNTYISPISITNHTGYKLQIQYYKKRVQIDAKGNPILKSEKESALEIGDSQSQPLNAEESLEEYDEAKGKVNSDFSYKFISFKIEHPDFDISKVSGVNIMPNISNKIVLKGKQKNLQDYKVIYSAKTNKDIKEIMISSSVLLVNSLPFDLNITIHHPFNKHQFSLSQGDEKYIPFDLVNFLFDISANGKKTTFRGKFESYCLKNSGYFTMISSENRDLHFVLKVFRDPKCYYLTKLVAIPGLYFRNNLPLPIRIQLINPFESKTFDLEKEQNFLTSEFDITKTVEAVFDVPGFRPSQPFPILENSKLVFPKAFKLYDWENKEAVISFVRIRDGYSHFYFAIYCNVVIINETPFDLLFNASESKKRNKPTIGGLHNIKGQDGFNKQVGLLGSQKTFLDISLNQNPKFRSLDTSNTISTQGIGAGVFQLPIQETESGKNGRFFAEIGYSTKLIYIEENDYIASKVVHLTPKTILYNSTKTGIYLTGDSVDSTVLNPDQKMPLYIYPDSQRRDKLTNFCIKDDGETYSSMRPLDINRAGTTHFLMANESNSKYRVFRVEITAQQDYLFITFSDRTQKEDILLINKTDFNLVLRQADVPHTFYISIANGKNAELAFADPYGPRAFEVEFYDPASGNFAGSCVIRMQKMVKEVYSIRNPKKFNIYSHLFLSKESRHLELSRAPDIIEQTGDTTKKLVSMPKLKHANSLKEQTKTDFTTIDINLHKIGVSIIARYLNQTIEMFYLYVDNIRFISLMAEDQQEHQFVINYINIDNNYSTEIKYPILLTATRSLERIKDSNFLNFHVIINTSPNENFINLDVFELEIMPVTVTTEYSLVSAILALKKQVDSIFKPKNSSEYLMKYFKPEENINTESLIEFTKVSEWQTINFKTSNVWVYCKELKISLIKVTLTFSMANYVENTNKEHSEDINVDLLIQTLGVTFLSIDESPITITGLRLQSIFESRDALLNTIWSHVKDQQNRNLAKLVGSLDIIGDPVSLFSNIGSGVVEFFEKPVTGFIRGPYEGFVGIAQGSGSLIKNTAAGTFNTISKVTSSLASGLTALSMDTNYLKQRNLSRAQKPKNLFEGVSKGFFSIGKGIFSGVTGVISQPIAEVKRSGATGIFKGMLKGVGGLIAKPLGSILDATSQAAEGIKKTVTVFDDAANDRKMRTPRVFYSTVRYIKPYNTVDSHVMRSLKVLGGGKFETDTFLDAVVIKSEQAKFGHIIVITHEHFIIMSEKYTSIEMFTEIKDVAKLKYVDENNLQLEYFFEGVKKQLDINTKKNNIFKIINSLNYCKYINYANMNK